LLTLRKENCQFRADCDFLPFLHQKLMQRAVVKALHLHGGLVGLDIRDHVANRNLVADLLAPLDQGALGHRVG
jgi:hypothetical protein